MKVAGCYCSMVLASYMNNVPQGPLGRKAFNTGRILEDASLLGWDSPADVTQKLAERITALARARAAANTQPADSIKATKSSSNRPQNHAA